MDDPKSLLFARLATERANLWFRLVGLDAEALVQQPMAGHWTAKDILAHVAAWDERHEARVTAIVANRAERIVHPDHAALNAQIYAERRDWSLERAIRATQIVRGDFLATIYPLSWGEITRERPTSTGETYTIRYLIQRRAEHDTLHAADIDAWRAGRAPEPGPQSLLVAAFDAARPALLSWGRLIPENERTTRRILGDWTWQDLLGHVADWEQFCVEGLRDMAAGRPAGTDYDPDWDRWNAAHAELRRGEPFGKTWDDFVQARWDLLELLEGFDDARLAEPAPSPVGDMLHYYDWFRVAVMHDNEHARDLSEALAAQAPLA